MKIETLKERIKNAEAKVLKITGTLARHNTQLAKKGKALTDKGIDLNSYDKRDKKISQETSWELYEYENKLEDIKSNDKKLLEANNTLTKLVEQLNNQLAKDESINDLCPQILSTFLENWKAKSFKYYTDLATEYIELVAIEWTEYKITRAELEKFTKEVRNKETRRYEMVNKYSEEQIQKILNNNITRYEKEDLQRSIRYNHIKEFESSHFDSDIFVLNRIIDHSIINNDILNKFLDEEVKRKKEAFILRIREVIGEFKNLDGLKIGATGEINGIAKGSKCNAKVETIGCAGYNIVCFHYRLLVNTVK